MADDLDRQRKRLLFRSFRRGTKESDLVIGGFAEAHLADMNARLLDQFEELLNQNDPDVLAWISALADPPDAFDNEIMEALRKFKTEMSNRRV